MGTSHRTIETKVYHFDQLSDEAKEKARDWWREMEATDISWSAERRDTLDAFCKQFPVEARNWEYDSISYHMNKVWTAGEASAEMSGKRLYGFIRAEYGPRLLWERKVYRKNGKERKSKIIMVETSCPMTGYCQDDDMLEPIRQYLKKPDMALTYQELMGQCLDAWGRSCVEDMAWTNSTAQVDETIIANEYEFDEEGARV